MQCKSYEDFAKFWEGRSEGARAEYGAKHKKGWNCWVAKFDSFACGVSSFMTDINPLLNVVSGLGPPYSGIAVGTIVFLFTGRFPSTL